MSTLAINTMRHQEVFNPLDHNKTPICIIGVGALGSRVFMSLVELGLTNIRIFDYDIVEDHNLANQAFFLKHLGMLKGDACIHLFNEKTGVNRPEEMCYFNGKLPEKHIDKVEGFVFLLVDSMEARKEIVNELKNNKNIYGIIDGRMASTYGNVLYFNPQVQADVKEWENTLINDADAEVSSCGTSLTVGTTANIIANLAVTQFMMYCIDDSSLQKRINIFLKPFIARGEFYE